MERTSQGKDSKDSTAKKPNEVINKNISENLVENSLRNQKQMSEIGKSNPMKKGSTNITYLPVFGVFDWLYLELSVYHFASEA